MNPYLANQITNAIALAENTLTTCIAATFKNDGKTDKEEERILKRVKRATERYVAELKKLM